MPVFYEAELATRISMGKDSPVKFFHTGTPIMVEFANEQAGLGLAHHGHPAVSFDIYRREVRIIRKVEE